MARSEREENIFLYLEQAVRNLCQQIDQVASRIPEEKDRAYAGVAKECLWTMYRRASEHAITRKMSWITDNQAGDGSSPA
jgi:hypothetical protein